MIFPSRPMMEPTAEPGTMSRKAFWPGHPGHFSAGFLPLAEAAVGSTEAIDSDEMRRRNRCCWCSRSGECCEKSRETARKWEFIWITLVRNVADVGPTPPLRSFWNFLVFTVTCTGWVGSIEPNDPKSRVTMKMGCIVRIESPFAFFKNRIT